MSQHDHEQFGMPLENIRAAEKWADMQHKKQRYHVRVPTRRDVRNMAPEPLSAPLVGWMIHSPIEIIPSQMQIALVIEILLQREDSTKLRDIITMCRHYVEGH